MTLRWLAGFAALGSALASIWCHTWLAAAVAGVIALVPLTAWVRGEFAATRTRMRRQMRAFAELQVVVDAMIEERSRKTFNTARRL